MINILIVEKDLNYSIKLMNNISQSNADVRLSGIATTITSALNIIKNDLIDIILINDEMMKKIKSPYLKKFKNSIIVLTDNTTTKFTQNDTYSYPTINKKDNVITLNKKINDIIIQTRNLYNTKDLRTLITDELTYLGYNPSYKGFQYLVETIYILNNLEDYYDDNLSRDIYPLVAEKFNTSPKNVKYNIRNAIEVMYFDCDENKLSTYLGLDISNKPKTKTMICAIENNIRKKIYNYS